MKSLKREILFLAVALASSKVLILTFRPDGIGEFILLILGQVLAGIAGAISWSNRE